MLTRVRSVPAYLFVTLSSFACAPSLHMPRAGDHYRGAAASATQTNHGLDDGRIAFDVEVRNTKPDGGFDATITVTEARLVSDSALQSGEALVGKSVQATFDGSGRLQNVAAFDGVDDTTSATASKALSALRITGSVSPIDLRTMKSERPRQASLPVTDTVSVIATFRAEADQRTSQGDPVAVVGIGGEQATDIALESHSVKAQVHVSGRVGASRRDLLSSETRLSTSMEYVDDTLEAQAGQSIDAKPLVATRTESFLVFARQDRDRPATVPSIRALGQNTGLLACSERIGSLASRIETMAPLYSAGDTRVPQIASELVQYTQDSGPRVVLGPEGTYVVDSAGTRGAALDRDQLGQALAQALPQSERVVVYIDADQSTQAKQLLDVASTLREMTSALEVQLEGRLLVGARSIKLPDEVSYPRLRDEAAPLEGASAGMRVSLLPQIMRDELGRTCYAGYRASTEAFAAGVPLGAVRRSVPGLIADCGCQGVDMQFVDGWLGLFDARVLGAGWIPLPGSSGSGKAVKLAKRASVADLIAQIEQLGLPANDIAQVKVQLR